jgi:hypothetical protein
MGLVNRHQDNRTTARSLPELVMAFLRKSKAQALPYGRALESIAYATGCSDRAQLRAVLAQLEASGRAVRDPGPQGLGDQRIPDRWRAL